MSGRAGMSTKDVRTMADEVHEQPDEPKPETWPPRCWSAWHSLPRSPLAKVAAVSALADVASGWRAPLLLAAVWVAVGLLLALALGVRASRLLGVKSGSAWRPPFSSAQADSDYARSGRASRPVLRSAMPPQRLQDDAVPRHGGDAGRVERRRDLDDVHRAEVDREATVRTAHSSSRVISPPGSAVPVPGRERRVEHVDVDGQVGPRRPRAARTRSHRARPARCHAR